MFKLLKIWFLLYTLTNSLGWLTGNFRKEPSTDKITVLQGGSITSALIKKGLEPNPQRIARIVELNGLTSPNIVQPGILLIDRPRKTDPKAGMIPISIPVVTFYLAGLRCLVSLVIWHLRNRQRELLNAKMTAVAATQAAKTAKDELLKAKVTEIELRALFKKQVDLIKVQDQTIYRLRDQSKGAPLTMGAALETLGLTASASIKEIKSRRRILMSYFHPDTGSPAIAATRINAAADLLISKCLGAPK